jgi:hypothetical protein
MVIGIDQDRKGCKEIQKRAAELVLFLPVEITSDRHGKH